LAKRLATCADDERVRVLILTGAGRAFCAGLDLKELGAGRADIGKTTVSSHGDPVGVMERLGKPVIGAINGAAVTGGFELALACDVLLASTEARFADTHARVGLASGWGLSQKLSRAIGIYRAREISLGGRWVSAEQAAAWGFVNRVVAPGELMPAARALAADMLVAQPGMLERYKSIIDDGFALPFGEGMALERQRARDFNATVTASDIEQRRESVRERNRSGH
jgi:enoyl-CoA hydratase